MSSEHDGKIEWHVTIVGVVRAKSPEEILDRIEIGYDGNAHADFAIEDIQRTGE